MEQARMNIRRCSKDVAPVFACSPTLVAIAEEANHQSGPGRRLGKAPRAAHEPFHPRPQVAVRACDLLGVLLAHCMLLGGEVSLVCPPSSRVKARDPTPLFSG